MKKQLTVVEICAGGGGQALGLDMAGFQHVGAIEIEENFCRTLSLNRPNWDVVCKDVKSINGRKYRGVDLLAGGVPCPPFSTAGKQLGSNDERDLFPEAVRLISEIKPKAVLLENVPGFAQSKFDNYRKELFSQIGGLGYEVYWKILHASDFGVPQLRPRFILVALQKKLSKFFQWPSESETIKVNVGSTLHDLIAERGWSGADKWKTKASGIAPTLVGGSKKHGGPDLGPTRAKQQWATLGVDGRGLADIAPGPEFHEEALPRLTVRMTARIQGFPDSWEFYGRKTLAYRQIGNAFPPPVARAVGLSVSEALTFS